MFLLVVTHYPLLRLLALEFSGDPSHQIWKMKNRLASLTACSLTKGCGVVHVLREAFWTNNITSTIADYSPRNEFFTFIRHYGVFQGPQSINHMLLVILLYGQYIPGTV